MEYITYRNKIAAIADGEEVGEVTFPMTGENTYNINHTYVDNRLRGQGQGFIPCNLSQASSFIRSLFDRFPLVFRFRKGKMRETYRKTIR